MQTCDDGFVLSFGQAVCWRVVCSGLVVFHPKEHTDHLETFAHKLGIISYEEKGGNLVWYYPLIDEDQWDATCGAAGFNAGISLAGLYTGPL